MICKCTWSILVHIYLGSYKTFSSRRGHEQKSSGHPSLQQAGTQSVSVQRLHSSKFKVLEFFLNSYPQQPGTNHLKGSVLISCCYCNKFIQTPHLKTNRNACFCFCFFSSGGQKSIRLFPELKTSLTWRLRGKSVPGCFQLLVTDDRPWLVALSLPSSRTKLSNLCSLGHIIFPAFVSGSVIASS